MPPRYAGDTASAYAHAAPPAPLAPGLRRCHPPCLPAAARRSPTAPALLRRYRASGAPTSRSRGTPVVDSLQQRVSRKTGPLPASARPCGPLRALRLVLESDVAGNADDAAPSRAGPRLNSPRTTRASAGQRRITARVMRSFTPSHGPRRRGPRLGVHTLPFQAHPRVASRPKSPAPAVATLFGLPATLRAGTESVLFPWRCSRRGRT